MCRCVLTLYFTFFSFTVSFLLHVTCHCCSNFASFIKTYFTTLPIWWPAFNWREISILFLSNFFLFNVNETNVMRVCEMWFWFVIVWFMNFGQVVESLLTELFNLSHCFCEFKWFSARKLFYTQMQVQDLLRW